MRQKKDIFFILYLLLLPENETLLYSTTQRQPVTATHNGHIQTNKCPARYYVKTFLSLVIAPVLGSRINATARDRLLTYLYRHNVFSLRQSCCLCLPRSSFSQWHSDQKVHTRNVTNTVSEKHSSGSVQESHLLPFSLAGAKVLLFFGTTKYFVIFLVFFLFRCDFRKFIARIRSQCDAKPLSC